MNDSPTLVALRFVARFHERHDSTTQKNNTAIRMSAKEILKDIVSNGIALDIFDVEEAFALVKLIGENADAINQARYGRFFGAYQKQLGRIIILSVARMFETNDRYQLRNIPAALKILREQGKKLKVLHRNYLREQLVGPGREGNTLHNLDDARLTELVVAHFEKVIPKAVESSDIALERALHALKTVRDKTVAHPEAVEWEDLPKPTYSELGELTELAKDFVSVVGLPYLGMAYRPDNGNYMLSSDAKRTSLCLKRMLRNLDVITSQNSQERN